MNQITGASQTTASPPPQTLPPESFGQLDRLDNGFGPAIPGQTREQWLEQARTSTNPDMRAFYNELVTLAGGRKDDAALNQVIDRYQALQNASTASEVQAAERGWLDQIGTMLSRFDPLNNLLNAVQPHLADMTRAAGLGETAWGASLQRVLDAPGSAAAFNDGLRAGILAGGKEMIVGTATTVGGIVQYGADTSLAGRAGDALRGLTGPLPGVIDAAVPSRARGAATSEALADMGGKIGTYLGSVADNPARLKTDIASTIDAQWSRLEASHAAAAARGPQAEARWWGETVGRVTFEVAAAVVPVTKVGTAANAVNGAADLARAADAAADAVRGAERVDAAGDAARVVTTADNAGHGSRMDRPSDSGNGGGPTVQTGGPDAPNDPDRVFIATDRGVVISDELLALKGTSRLVGDFRGIAGARVEEIISRVPSDWTMLPQQRGMGIRFIDSTGAERLRLHGPSANAPAGSNAASGWTARVHVSGASNQYFDNAGNIVGPRNNDGHIPIFGNANLR
jgi:Bacterial toxin 30